MALQQYNICYNRDKKALLTILCLFAWVYQQTFIQQDFEGYQVQFLFMSTSMREPKEITHWTPEEEINYNIFLIYKANELFTFKSKPPGFYVQMSHFIPSRSKVQCRSHHEKMIGRFRDQQNCQKKDLQLLNIKAFFRDHIALRLLDSKHLLKEIDHHLQKKYRQGLVTKQFLCLFKERAQNNLQMFNLDEEVKDKQMQPQKAIQLEQGKGDIGNQKTYSQPHEYHLSYLFEPIEQQSFIHEVYFVAEEQSNF